MKADEIRQEGIAAPGNTYTGGSGQDSDVFALGQNVAILCGMGLEIAAQLAEINTTKLVEFQLVASVNVPAGSVWVNPKTVMAIVPRSKGGTYIFLGPSEDDAFLVQEAAEDVMRALRA